VLDVKGIGYTGDHLNVRKVDLKVDTNVTDIVLDASLKDGQVIIKELSVKEVDALALKTLFVPDGNESNVSDEGEVLATADTNTTEDTQVNPFIPKSVHLDTLEITILPLVYDPVDIRYLSLTGRDAFFDVEKLVLEKANLDLNSSTNLSDIVYKTRVRNNKLIGNVVFKPKKSTL